MMLWTIYRLAADLQPHIVQTWIPMMDVLGGLVAKALRLPWILSERNSALGNPNTVRNRLRAALATKATAIVSNSKGGDEYWSRILPVNVQRYIIPNGIPLDEIGEIHPE